ncbi:MAG TPA: acyloxyacyl hydrolase [Thermoanaerobaculia bacterium]|nr:acyloxyacyl hydrolase [Thermoanaerobaculia bacterium]
MTTRRRGLVTALLGAAALALSLAAPAQEAPEEALPPAASRSAWSLAGAWGHTVELVTADRTSSHLLLLAPQWTYRLSQVVEGVAEGHVAGYVGDADGWMLGIVPLGFRFRVPDSPWLPYLSVGAGFGWTNLRIIEINRRFDFILCGGFGVRPGGETSPFSVEIRLVHYSNAGTVPPNYGLNSLALVGAWRLP